MAKEKNHGLNSPENPPDWYWTHGLHDACIIGYETFEFPADYNKFSGKKYGSIKSLMTLTIDAENALYDTAVSEIRLLNFEILTPDIPFEGKEKLWWLSDRLTKDGGRFILEITLFDPDSFPENFTFKVGFERAEVVRT